MAKEESAKEIQNVMARSGARFRSYSTLGLRGDSDLLFWFGAPSVEEIQGAAARVYSTVLGKYLLPSRAYLSCTRPSAYAEKGGLLPFEAGAPPRRYAVVYPLTKTREWYLLPAADRRRMMDEHIRVGQKYPGVLLNTTYSFGLHDEDFMLAFECDDLPLFQDLIVELRETAVSGYVAADTPMIVCVSKDIIPLVASLG